MKVMIACELSGRVRDGFRRRGHQALSCDFLENDSFGPHYQGDVFDIIADGWDLMIAHPPCTYLANSGVMWFTNKPKIPQGGLVGEERWIAMREAAEFFRRLKQSAIPKIAIENPIPHKY